MPNTIITNYDRHARHEWCCCKCHGIIKTGDRYKDQEIKTTRQNYSGCDTVIMHNRYCQYCAGYAERPRTYEIHGEEPVSFKGTKEWLVGKGFNRQRQKRLLTLDWDRGEYHWRSKVKAADGHSMYFGNVRFVYDG